MAVNRIQRINALIQEELGKIIVKEVEFPPNTLATITGVKTSVDLANTSVYISVIPEAGGKRVVEILNKIVYGLQQILNKKLKMRPVPKIRFIEEKNAGQAARIEELLEEVKSASAEGSGETRDDTQAGL